MIETLRYEVACLQPVVFIMAVPLHAFLAANWRHSTKPTQSCSASMRPQLFQLMVDNMHHLSQGLKRDPVNDQYDSFQCLPISALLL